MVAFANPLAFHIFRSNRVLCGSLLTLVALINSLAVEELPPWENLETGFGQMKVREFGPQDGPLVVLIHGLMDSELIRDEWNPVAQKLARAGFHAIVPDFHHAPELLTPSKLTGADLRELFTHTLSRMNRMIPARYHSVVRPKAIVMGKSWGARMAAEVGSLEEVVATALMVPALGDDAQGLLSKVHGRVAVGLVRDDQVVNFDSTSKKLRAATDRRDITWLEADAGGHRVVPEFVDPLVQFAQEARELFVHDTEL